MRFSGKVALVTGTGSGAGTAAVRLVGSEGAKVVLVSDTAKEIERVAAEMQQHDDGRYV